MPPQRGEVWSVRFDPAVGAEIQKLRPAVVISVIEVGCLPLRLVVPLTDWKPPYANFPWFVRLAPTRTNGLSKESGADAYQVKSVSDLRFVSKLDSLTATEMDGIAAAVALCIGYR